MSNYIVAWLYEPGMPVAIPIAFASEPRQGHPQVVGCVTELIEHIGYEQQMLDYRDGLVKWCSGASRGEGKP